jgi:hypothetical protein
MLNKQNIKLPNQLVRLILSVILFASFGVANAKQVSGTISPADQFSIPVKVVATLSNTPLIALKSMSYTIKPAGSFNNQCLAFTNQITRVNIVEAGKIVSEPNSYAIVPTLDTSCNDVDMQLPLEMDIIIKTQKTKDNSPEQTKDNSLEQTVRSTLSINVDIAITASQGSETVLTITPTDGESIENQSEGNINCSYNIKEITMDPSSMQELLIALNCTVKT